LTGGGAGETAGSGSAPFDLPAGDWRELTVEIPTAGLPGVIRLYLPAHEKPVEIDWIELRPKAAAARGQRWEFGGKLRPAAIPQSVPRGIQLTRWRRPHPW